MSGRKPAPTRPGASIDDAACAEVDPNLWFPGDGQSSALARSVCRRCAVTAECLQYALDNDLRWGVWGGVSERNRRDMHRAKWAADRRVS